MKSARPHRRKMFSARPNLGAADLVSMLDNQREIFERIARDEPSADTLGRICEIVEQALPDSIAVILQANPTDQSFSVGAAPNVSEALAIALAMPTRDTASYLYDPARTTPTIRRPLLVTDLTSNGPSERIRSACLSAGFRSLWAMPVMGESDDPLGVIVVLWSTLRSPTDEEKSTHQALVAMTRNALLRYETQQTVLDLVTRERNRIAGELHDDSIQAVTAVSLRLQRLRARLDDEDQIQLIDDARIATDEAISRLRSMLFRLHPQALEHDGLAPTIEAYIEDLLRHDTAIEWEVIADESQRSTAAVEALLFRLCREAISNAVKHASASHIKVTLEFEPDVVRVTVVDDGQGFDIDDHRPPSGHLGLAHSKVLAHSGGGEFEVTSILGEGTTVEITAGAPA